ncbi:MAG: M1 family peptidase, partial [Flavobacteriales bacterium]|nr:M1 family peptidase [Flavobacteriales bacterium]
MKSEFTHLLLLTLLCASTVIGSEYDPLNKPNSYNLKSNPHYWKNKLPFEGYWQQDVHYDIKASINDSSDIITGNETITYWNNSPDNLN